MHLNSPNKSVVQYLEEKHLMPHVAETDKRVVFTAAQFYKRFSYVEAQSEAFVLPIASLDIL